MGRAGGASIRNDAAARGWAYADTANWIADRWEGHDFSGNVQNAPFRPGRPRPTEIRYVVSGDSEGTQFWAFDYLLAYVGHQGGARRMVLFIEAGRPVPPVCFVPNDNLLGQASSKIRTRLFRANRERQGPGRMPGMGFLGVDLGDEEFARRFRVFAPDLEAARSLLTPTVRAVMLEKPAYALATRGADIISWRDTNFDLGEVEPMVRLVKAASASA